MKLSGDLGVVIHMALLTVIAVDHTSMFQLFHFLESSSADMTLTASSGQLAEQSNQISTATLTQKFSRDSYV